VQAKQGLAAQKAPAKISPGMQANTERIKIIGAGYSGMAAAFELAKAGEKVEIYEADSEVGGLAGTFEFAPGIRVEKFYHHWFTSDTAVLSLIEELGLGHKIKRLAANTGLYYANSIFRLASPWDLLRFNPIPLVDRVRTGLMALYARRINHWDALETESAISWIKRIGGKRAFEVIWRPLLYGKFGSQAEKVSAVWFWNKLKLRGSSRGKDSNEELIYFDGTFGALNQALRTRLESLGVKFHLNCKVQHFKTENGKLRGFETSAGFVAAGRALATMPLPAFLKAAPDLPPEYAKPASQIPFLGSVCMVLSLKRSLSSTYWLNVADPSFPFVGVIEHTNLDSPQNYGGNHIAYLTKYLETSDALYQMNAEELLNFSIPHLKRMFPEFSRDLITSYNLWKAPYTQPVTVCGYSKLIPAFRTPIAGLWLCTMAQIYPQDRGTNYAVQYGQRVAKELLQTPPL
jgi:protoporphyrinogen oxidase